ncbi:antirestriction protein ArdC [Sphingomonas sp. UYAg733]
MSNSDHAQRPANSLYAEVTDRIIAELEAGRLPWVRPWDTGFGGAGLPCNAGTGRRYSGINVLILWHALAERGFGSQRWITYRQAQDLGGYVRKGERGTTVFYADRFTPRNSDSAQLPLEGEEQRQIAFLKRFTVFNLEQCDGVSRPIAAEPSQALPERELIPQAEALIAASGADFRIGGDEAYYVPSLDYIQVPPQQAYREQINWYRTVLHELGHWTAHTSRLGRLENDYLKGLPYAREELVAEMCCAFVCAELGIMPTVRHSDYIATWLDVLKDDSRAIFRAASQASKAADYLLAFRRDVSEGKGAGH